MLIPIVNNSLAIFSSDNINYRLQITRIETEFLHLFKIFSSCGSRFEFNIVKDDDSVEWLDKPDKAPDNLLNEIVVIARNKT